MGTPAYYDAPMGPFTNQSVASRTAAEEAEERRLAAARDAFPGWKIIETFGGFLAVPDGAPVIQSVDLDGLVRKLRDPSRWER